VISQTALLFIPSFMVRFARTLPQCSAWLDLGSVLYFDRLWVIPGIRFLNTVSFFFSFFLLSLSEVINC